MPDKIDKLLASNFHFDPCYLPALLKVSTQLRGGADDRLEELLESTLSESNLSQEDLEQYIEEHKTKLVEEAKRLAV
jgi:hypothetical protein